MVSNTRRHLVSLLAFAVLAALGVGSMESSTETQEKATQDVQKSTPVAKVTAGKLWADYKKDVPAADLKYKNQVVELNGAIASKGRDSSDVIFITFAVGTGDDKGTVEVRFQEATRSKILQLTDGQTVVIKGKCSGLSAYNNRVVIDGAVLLKQGAVPSSKKGGPKK